MVYTAKAIKRGFCRVFTVHFLYCMFVFFEKEKRKCTVSLLYSRGESSSFQLGSPGGGGGDEKRKLILRPCSGIGLLFEKARAFFASRENLIFGFEDPRIFFSRDGSAPLFFISGPEIIKLFAMYHR